jgi:hypothetical protein
MPWTTNVLVVANSTAASPELVGTLVSRDEHRPTNFTLLVPASRTAGGWNAARDRLTEALDQLHAAGLRADGRLGSGDPVLAVNEEWDPARYDELILSTPAVDASDWVDDEVPERVERLTGARVTHVVPPQPALSAF